MITVFPTLPLHFSQRINVIHQRNDLRGSDGSILQSQLLSLFGPRYVINVRLDNAVTADETLFWDYYFETFGGFTRVAYFHNHPDKMRSWGDAYLGRADGVTGTFDLLSKNTTSLVITKDGVEISADQYDISYGTGNNGQDQVVFHQVPAAGVIKAAKYKGTLYIPKVTLVPAEQGLAREDVEVLLHSVGINLESVP